MPTSKANLVDLESKKFRRGRKKKEKTLVDDPYNPTVLSSPDPPFQILELGYEEPGLFASASNAELYSTYQLRTFMARKKTLV